MNEWLEFVGDGLPYERTCQNLTKGPVGPADDTLAREVMRAELGDMALNLTFSPDGKLVAAGSGPELRRPYARVSETTKASIRNSAGAVWAAETGKEVMRMQHYFFAFSPDGRWVATSGRRSDGFVPTADWSVVRVLEVGTG